MHVFANFHNILSLLYNEHGTLMSFIIEAS